MVVQLDALPLPVLHFWEVQGLQQAEFPMEFPPPVLVLDWSDYPLTQTSVTEKRNVSGKRLP